MANEFIPFLQVAGPANTRTQKREKHTPRSRGRQLGSGRDSDGPELVLQSHSAGTAHLAGSNRLLSAVSVRMLGLRPLPGPPRLPGSSGRWLRPACQRWSRAWNSEMPPKAPTSNTKTCKEDATRISLLQAGGRPFKGATAGGHPDTIGSQSDFWGGHPEQRALEIPGRCDPRPATSFSELTSPTSHTFHKSCESCATALRTRRGVLETAFAPLVPPAAGRLSLKPSEKGNQSLLLCIGSSNSSNGSGRGSSRSSGGGFGIRDSLSWLPSCAGTRVNVHYTTVPADAAMVRDCSNLEPSEPLKCCCSFAKPPQADRPTFHHACCLHSA